MQRWLYSNRENVMIKLNLFDIAEQQLLRENKKPTLHNIVKYATKIRHWMDKHPKATIYILNGGVHKSNQAKHIFKKKYGST